MLRQGLRKQKGWQWTGAQSRGHALGCSTVQIHRQIFIPSSDVQQCSRCATKQGCSLEPGAQGLLFQVKSGTNVNENKGTNEITLMLSSVILSNVKKY